MLLYNLKTGFFSPVNVVTLTLASLRMEAPKFRTLGRALMHLHCLHYRYFVAGQKRGLDEGERIKCWNWKIDSSGKEMNACELLETISQGVNLISSSKLDET